MHRNHRLKRTRRAGCNMLSVSVDHKERLFALEAKVVMSRNALTVVSWAKI